MLVISGVVCALKEIWRGREYRGVWLISPYDFKVPVSGRGLKFVTDEEKLLASEAMERMIKDFCQLNGVQNV